MSYKQKLKPKNKIDVNNYILIQLRRKMEPFYIRNRLARARNFFCSQFPSPIKQNKQKFRMSQGANLCSYQNAKMAQCGDICKTVAIQYTTTSREPEKLQKNMTEKQKRYHQLQGKVQKYISEQKKRICQREEMMNSRVIKLAENNSQAKYNRKIVSNLQGTFDFSKIQKEVKKNSNNYYMEQLQNKHHFLNFLSPENSPQKNKQKKKNIKPKQTKDNKENTEQQQIIRMHKTNDRKRTKMRTHLTTRSSIMLAFDNQIPDSVDQQFEEGLVEEIYTTKRLKYRKRINQARSRKNLVQGSMYFLKD